MPIIEFKNRLIIEQELPDEDKERYNTVGGLFTWLSGRLPEVGEEVTCAGWLLKVTALQGRRIDRLSARSTQGADAEQHGMSPAHGHPTPKG